MAKKNTITKTVRIEILKPLNTDWETLGKILNDVQYETWKILNKSIQFCLNYSGFTKDFYKVFGKYPIDSKDRAGYFETKEEREMYKKDVFEGKLNIESLIDNSIKHKLKAIGGNNKQATIKYATDKWQEMVSDISKGKISAPTFKRDGFILLKGDQFEIQKFQDNGYTNYILNANLCSQSLFNELGLKIKGVRDSKVPVVLRCEGRYQTAILDRILSGEYIQGQSQILKEKNKRKKKKWYLNLTYKLPKKENVLNDTKIMGIDMGIVYPLYMAFNEGLDRYNVKGGEIEQFRKQVENRKNEMYEQGKYCGEGRVGHGIKTRIKPISFAQGKIANFRDTTNHKYSKYVIDMAIKHNCGVIQMEDLKGISTDNKFLKNWTYFDLQTKIKYKAEEKGIEVIKIKPNYTSQRCNKCGFINKDNRSDQKTFKCTECGLKTNADFNAAKNIATQDIEKIIEEQIKKQKEEGTWKTLKNTA